MRLQNFIKPAILTCALTANICSAAVSMPDFMKSDEHNYNFVTVKGGIVSPAAPLSGTSDLNTGNATWTGGVLVGRKFMDRFAVDAEYMYRGKNTSKNVASNAEPCRDTWSVKSNTFMLSLSADLIKDDKFRPYVRVGAGISNNKPSTYINIDTTNSPATIINYKGRTTNDFAYQLGAGLSMNTSKMFDTQLEYMYINRGKIKTTSAIDSLGNSSPAITGYIQDHIVTAGIKFKF